MSRHRISARSFSVLRLAGAMAVVVACVAAVWFLGREQVENEVGVLLTAEPWPAGSAGLFVEVAVPESLSGLFGLSDQLEEGMVSSVFLPEGVMVPSVVLREPSLEDKESDETLMRLEVDRSLWPSPGPLVGDRAVFAVEVGGCALEVIDLVGVDESAVTVVVDRESARDLSEAELVVWESPASGWTPCPGPPEETPVASDETLMRLEVDRSLWPSPGPLVGDRAVFAVEVGGCALGVIDLVGVDESAVTVVVDRESAGALRDVVGLVVWKSPAAGWEPC